MAYEPSATVRRHAQRPRSTGARAVLAAIGLLAAACGAQPVASPPAPGSASTPAASASAVASVSASARASAPPSSAGTLESRLEAVLEDQAHLAEAGIAVAVIAGEDSWAGAAGIADRAAGREMTPDTTFAIGSITKSMVAAAVLLLAEDGLVDLDTRIADYLPADLSEIANDATVREVLGHHSGIGEHTRQPFFEDVVADPDRTWSNREALAYVEPSTFPAGEGWAYSNTNYILLDILIEEVTGEATGDVIRERLLEPHGLDRISYQATDPPPEPTAVGYTDLDNDGAADAVEGGGLLPTRALATAAGAAGGVAADAPSVARWADLLYGGEVLEPSSLEAMLDFSGSHGPPYGLGTEQVRMSPDVLGVGHTGGIPGFQSAVVHVPTVDVTVAMLTNGDFSAPLDPMSIVRTFVQALGG